MQEPQASHYRSVKPAQSLHKTGEIGRPRRFEAELNLAGWVKKAEHARVQRLARKLGGWGKGDSFLFAFGTRAAARAAIGRIADQRMTDMGQMDSDLMRASGLEPALEQRSERFLSRAELFDDRVARARGLALAAQHGHAFAIERIAPEIALDDAGASARAAPDDSVVDALDGMRGELLGEASHRVLVLGDDQEAAGVLVQPVHDAGARDAADAGERGAAMGEQRVDQRAVDIAGGGMHDEAGGFDEDDEVGILVQDAKRNVLRDRVGGRGRGHDDRIGLARFDPVIGVSYRRVVVLDVALLDQSLQPRARHLGESARQEVVQPPALGRLGRADLPQASVYG